MTTQLDPLSAPTYRDLFREGRAALSLTIILLLFVATLDVLIVATAMPTILAQLGGVSLYSWAFSSYTLASIAALPVFAALTARWGLLRITVLALGIFALGSVVGAVAPSMLVLVLGRAVQGIGAGGLFTIPYIVIGSSYPSALQPRALALTSGVWGVSSLGGPIIGALLLHLGGWPAIFWVNLPICAGVLLLGYRSLRASPGGDSSAAPANLTSPLLLALAAGLLLAAPSASGLAAAALAALGLGAALAFAASERRSAFPIIPPVAWRAAGSLGAALAVTALAAVGFFAAETFLPLLIQSGRGYSAVESGLLISLGSITWSLGSLLISRSDDPRPQASTALGLTLMSLGVALLLFFILFDLPLPLAYLGWGVAGLGMGCLVPVCLTVILDAARGPQAAGITASSQIAMSLGAGVGAALSGVAAAVGFGPHFEPGHLAVGAAASAARDLIDRGVVYALLLALAFMLAGFVLVRRLPQRREVAE